VEGNRDLNIIRRYLPLRRDIDIVLYSDLKKVLNIDDKRYVLILTDFDLEGERIKKVIETKLRDLGGYKILGRERNIIKKLTNKYGREIHGIFKALINKLGGYSYEYIYIMYKSRDLEV